MKAQEEMMDSYWTIKRKPQKGMATYSSILTWGILWTEESASYSPHGYKESVCLSD